MVVKIIHRLGFLVIFLFSAISIFFSSIDREFAEGNFLNKLFSYASFFENRFYDMRMLQTLNEGQPDSRILLAAIDDYSIKKVGRWPFPRQNYSLLMKKLKGFGAKVLVYDILFFEKSLTYPGSHNVDAQMAEGVRDFQSIPGNKVIFPYLLENFPHEETYREIPNIMYRFALLGNQRERANLIPWYLGKNTFPISSLIEAEPAIGHTQGIIDSDGIFRHHILVANVEGSSFPSIALMAYQYFTHDKPRVEIFGPGENRLKLKSGTLGLNSSGESKIRWSGGPKTFPTISFWDIITADDNDQEMRQKFQGNIVFIGSTAVGAHDLRHTPIGPLMPGVYLHMNMTKMLLDGKVFIPNSDSTYYSWLILIISTLAIILLQLFKNALFDIIAVFILLGGLYHIDTYFLLPRGHDSKLFFCFFSVLACYFWNTFLNSYLANKKV